MGLNWAGGLSGGAGGAAMGGPWGAGLGGLMGLFGGGNDESSTSSQQRSGVNLRDLSPQERALLESSQQNIMAGMRGMTPEQQQAFIAEQQQAYFDPMKRSITESYAQNMGRMNSAYLRGGMAGSSKMMSDNQELARATAGQLGSAQAQARQMGEQSFFGRDQNRMANLGANQSIWGQMAGQRLNESDRWSSGTSTNRGPDTTVASGMGMLGYGMTDPNSYYNKRGGFGGMFSGVKSLFGRGGNRPNFPTDNSFVGPRR